MFSLLVRTQKLIHTIEVGAPGYSDESDLSDDEDLLCAEVASK